MLAGLVVALMVAGVLVWVFEAAGGRRFDWSPTNTLALVVLTLIVLALLGVVGCEASVRDAG